MICFNCLSVSHAKMADTLIILEEQDGESTLFTRTQVFGLEKSSMNQNSTRHQDICFNVYQKQQRVRLVKNWKNTTVPHKTMNVSIVLLYNRDKHLVETNAKLRVKRVLCQMVKVVFVTREPFLCLLILKQKTMSNVSLILT